MTAFHLQAFLRRLRQAEAPAVADAELLARFVARRDEAAFTALVRRHGPLVLNVCRRMLGDDHAAEDAFQATFLLLARKAGSLARPELLGNWLHGVACRIAARARADSIRRHNREKQVPAGRPVEPDESVVWREVRGVLDEELNRLPEHYRAPLVLCYLQGHTNAEAARLLGCSRGTVATLLARGRERLRGRLVRRGLAFPVGLAGLVLTQATPAAGVSLALEASTVQAAMLFAAGNLPAAGAVAAQAISLAKGVATAMLIDKLKVTALALVTGLTLAGAGAGLLSRHASADQPMTATDKPPVRPILGREQPPPQRAGAAPDKDVYRSANFEVVAPSGAIARQLGRAAEERRKAVALLWLGKELPTWQKRCLVRVKITERGEDCATSFAFERGKVLSQEMFLEGRLDRIETDLLPHEITHTVLAHHFGRPLPRWADEGAALLSESAPSGGRHERALQKIIDEGRLMPLRQLLPLRQYPRDVMALYAQGYSLTEYLVRADGRAKFLEFLSLAERDGWDRAVMAQYGHAKVEDLEKAWLASLATTGSDRSEPTTTKLSGRSGWSVPRRGQAPRGQLAAGPAPEQALVTLEADGLLSVWRVGPSDLAGTTPAGEGKAVTPDRPVRAMHLLLGSFRLDEVKVHDPTGKVLEPADVAKRLRGETLALISPDGRAVDPLHLRLVKEATLVFVLPASVAGRPVRDTPAVPVQPSATFPAAKPSRMNPADRNLPDRAP